jgi:hypothetical protein
MRYHDEFDKGKLLAYLILFSMAVCLMTCAFGCGVRTKSTHSFVEKVDSTFTQVKKETAQVVNDSAKVIKTVEGKTDSSSLKIEFQDDTTKSNEPVIIEYDTVGRLVINSGGRRIKSITNTNKKKQVKETADSAHVVNSSNIVKSDSTNIDLSKSVKSVSSKKFTFQLPWFAYVIGVVAIGLTWFFWPHIKAAKTVSDKLPYSSPNDKS